MGAPIGKRRWVTADGYIPPDQRDKSRELISHEGACPLNAGDQNAHVQLTLYFTDREPAGPYRVTVPARRMLHLRFNDLKEPEPIAAGADHFTLIEPGLPIVVQHARLDSRSSQSALLTTLAVPSG